jgi:hypothetical protein
LWQDRTIVSNAEDAMDGSAVADAKSVIAPLNFLVPMAEKPVAYNYEPPPGAPIRTGQSITHKVPIRDARPMIGRLSLDKEGFVLLHQPTAVTNFYDEEQIKTVYYPECERVMSLEEENLVASDLKYPDRVGETYSITYNPNQRYYYFPKMQADEAVLIRCFDSALAGPQRFSAHTGFDDPESPADAPPRESIEVRTLVFFPPGA